MEPLDQTIVVQIAGMPSRVTLRQLWGDPILSPGATLTDAAVALRRDPRLLEIADLRRRRIVSAARLRFPGRAKQIDMEIRALKAILVEAEQGASFGPTGPHRHATPEQARALLAIVLQSHTLCLLLAGRHVAICRWQTELDAEELASVTKSESEKVAEKNAAYRARTRRPHPPADNDQGGAERAA